jgi:hypothetical protein
MLFDLILIVFFSFQSNMLTKRIQAIPIIKYWLSGNQMQFGRSALPTIQVGDLGLPHKYSTKFVNWFACRSHPPFQYL